MKQIPLTQGQCALVDDADFGWLTKWKWRARLDRKSRNWYAERTIWVGGKCKSISMHRDILGLQKWDGFEVDHKNCNTLDNQRTNLRTATRVQNQRNRGANSNNRSGFKGVSAHRNRWMAQIGVNGKHVHLGYFSTPELAHDAYRKALILYHGEFARSA